MAMLRLPLDALRAGFDWLRRNPTELITVARAAAGLRVSAPLDALRWLLARAPQGKRSPKDVVIGQRPPAMTLAATIDLMGNPVRADAAIKVEEIRLGPDELRVTLRLSDVKLVYLGDNPQSPVGVLLKSGALDLSKPANLANFMPKRPIALVEAKDDTIVLDLARVPKIGANPRVKKILSVITPVLVIRDVRVEDEHLYVSWRPRLTGLPTSLAALRA